MNKSEFFTVTGSVVFLALLWGLCSQAEKERSQTKVYYIQADEQKIKIIEYDGAKYSVTNDGAMHRIY